MIKKALVLSVFALGMASFSSIAADTAMTHEDAAVKHEAAAKHHKKAAKHHKEGKNEEAKKEASMATDTSKAAHEKTMEADAESAKK